MSIAFPAAPVDGDLFVDGNDTWGWDDALKVWLLIDPILEHMPSIAQDLSVIKGRLATQLASSFLKDGSIAMTGDLQLDNHKITKVLTPTAPTDAANKAYVDASHGVPAGGTTGEALVKTDGTDFNMQWSPISSGTTLPTDAAGTLTNDGSGTLSWAAAAVASVAWGAVTNKPTLLAGYGITDALNLGPLGTDAAAGDHTHAFSEITSTPTTLAGYGIIDGGGSPTTSLPFSSITSTPTTLAGYGIVDGGGSSTTSLPFSSITSTPTSIAGYGITDALKLGMLLPIFAPISHTHPFTEITATPTTTAGYGITDVAITCFSDTASYAANDMVKHADGIWRSNGILAPAPWDASKWTRIDTDGVVAVSGGGVVGGGVGGVTNVVSSLTDMTAALNQLIASQLYIERDPTASQSIINDGSPSDTPLNIQGRAGQTGHLQSWSDAYGYELATILSDGGIRSETGNVEAWGKSGIEENVAIGSNALQKSTATYNVALGHQALKNSTTGANNTAMGGAALINFVTGGDNTAVGQGAFLYLKGGSKNVAIGQGAGQNIINTSNNNTVIGAQGGASSTGAGAINDTVLVTAGTTERLKVEITGMAINGNPAWGAHGPILKAVTSNVMYALTGAVVGELVFNINYGKLYILEAGPNAPRWRALG